MSVHPNTVCDTCGWAYWRHRFQKNRRRCPPYYISAFKPARHQHCTNPRHNPQPEPLNALTDRPKTYVYIAGPYGDKDPYCVIDARINEARKAARMLALAGIPYYSPHLNCAHFEVVAPDAPVEFWIAMGMVFVGNAWGVWLLKNWTESRGTLAEIARAEELGIEVFGKGDDELEPLIEAWRA